MLQRGLACVRHGWHGHLVLVDGGSMSRAQRSDILRELRHLRWRQRGCRVLLVDFCHPGDAFTYGADAQLAKRPGDAHVAICEGRIETRGAAHPTLRPFPGLRALLRGAARAMEPPLPEEIRQHDARVTIDVLQPPPQASLVVIEELRTLGWMTQMPSVDELRPKVEVAWQAYQRAESQWREGAAAAAQPEPHEAWLTQCRQVLDLDKTMPAEVGLGNPACHAAGPLAWRLDVPEVSKVLAQRGILPAHFVPAEHPHVVLLRHYGSDPSMVAGSTFSPDQFQAMHEALEALQGEEFEVRMMEIVIEASIACAIVALPPILQCATQTPYVTLGTRLGVPATHAEEVFKEVRAGRTVGITSIPLPTPRPLRGRLVLETGTHSGPACA